MRGYGVTNVTVFGFELCVEWYGDRLSERDEGERIRGYYIMYDFIYAFGGFSLTPRRGRLAKANLTLYTVVRLIVRRNV